MSPTRADGRDEDHSSDARAASRARTSAVVLLAAGRGSRFGGGKLAASLAGRPLVHHAAAPFAALPFARRFVVRAPETPPLDAFGFEALDLDPPDAPLSRSIAIGVAAARRAQIEAVVVALADMPFVPERHLRALLAAFDGDRIATRVGERISPPAVFGRSRFDDLVRLHGDRGAQELLRDAPLVALSEDAAADVDTAGDLERARERLARAETGETEPTASTFGPRPGAGSQKGRSVPQIVARCITRV